MMTAPSVALRFQPNPGAVEFDKLPAGGYTETFSLAHFAEAWKKLTEAIWALPAL